MTTLCIETATEHGMVVVSTDDGSVATARWRSAGRHGENLFGYLDAVLAETGTTRDSLSLIGVDVGPGRFTSLRVGLATAKGLALGLGLPIVGVSALRVLARTIEDEPALARVPVMNAYRGDVFAAAYVQEGSHLQELVPPTFGEPSEVFTRVHEALDGRSATFAGEGVAPHAEALTRAFGFSPDAKSLERAAPAASALLFEVSDAMERHGPSDLASLEPQYLRPSDAKLPDRPLRVENTR